MSFLSDLLGGHFSNLGNDLSPSNVFNDFGTDLSNTLKNPIADLGIAAGIALPFLAPEIGTLFGGLGADLGLGGGAATGAAVGAPLNLASAVGDSSALSFAGDTTGLAAAPGITAIDSATSAPLITSSFTPAGLVSSDFATLGEGVSSTGAAIANAPLSIAPAATSAISGAAAPGTISNFFSGLTGGLVSPSTMAEVGSNLPKIVGLGSLGASLYSGYEQNKALSALTNQENANAQQAAQTAQEVNAAAAPLLSSGEALTNYLKTGTLPPDFQAQVTQQVNAAKASIIQGYAARGQNTNPQQNSALAQDLSNVDLQAQSLSANLESTLATAGNQMVTTANSLISSGLSATQLSSEIPIQISQLNMQLNTQISNAISGFAAALNGGGTARNAITLSLPNNIISPTGQLTL